MKYFKAYRPVWLYLQMNLGDYFSLYDNRSHVLWYDDMLPYVSIISGDIFQRSNIDVIPKAENQNETSTTQNSEQTVDTDTKTESDQIRTETSATSSHADDEKVASSSSGGDATNSLEETQGADGTGADTDKMKESKKETSQDKVGEWL